MSCQITPVHLKDDDNEVSVWNELRREWHSRNGKWRQYLPFYGGPGVDVVKVSIAGRPLRNNKTKAEEPHFIGICSSRDLVAERKRLQTVIQGYEPQEYPCPYNAATGKTECYTNCISNHAGDVRCPEGVLHEAERSLVRLVTQPFLRLAFLDPNTTKGNELLKSEGIILCERDLLSALDSWHVPDLRELQFSAIRIEERWRFSPRLVSASVLLVLLVIIISSRLVYGDWGIAYSAGNFFVALGAVPWIIGGQAHL
ncbi:hypothetical protein BJX64DRAFT_271353 [Aspergillus heterothallicus]